MTDKDPSAARERSTPWLRKVLAPVEPSAFVREHWGTRPLHVKGSAAKFAEIFDRASLDSLIADRASSLPEELKFRATFSAERWISTRMAVTRPDLSITRAQVRPLLAAGCTIQVGNVHAADMRVRRFTAALKAELSFAGEIDADCWISSRDNGANTHFDAQAVLVLQVDGTKVWRVSPGPALRWPKRTGFRVAPGEVFYAEGEPEAWEGELVSFDDSELFEVVLEPGDLLFLPAGTYHTTRAASEAESVGLHLHFQRTSFLDVFLEAARSALESQAEWRHLPISLADSEDHGLPPEVRTFFAARLNELAVSLTQAGSDSGLLRAWKKSIAATNVEPRTEISSAPVKPDDTLRLIGATTVQALLTDPEGNQRWHIFSGSKEISLDDPELFELARQLVKHRDGFRAAEAATWTRGATLEWNDIAEILEALLQEGILERV